MHDCPNKAILNTPMSDAFHRRADAWLKSGRTEKEDLVLMDVDDKGHFDPSKLKLPPGARLVPLSGYDRSQIISLYERAKVYVDTYITGMERAVFESSLFRTVTIVAHNGQAQDMLDFPIPQVGERGRLVIWPYGHMGLT